MVHLISLKMQGVRSIGAEPHSIDFLRPLTLIQGPNGTGKTTIIEALNYVTSGGLPSGKLATFVHDPKIANKTKIDGMVQLKFEDSKKCEVTATKRMTASVSKTAAGVSVKSDESTFRVMQDGKETNTSSKVGDYYVHVMNRLGVNKAVLDYVIFCHQEESNWPLSESKKLKERFDEIFEVSEYVEIMENIKTHRKILDKRVAEIDKEIQNHLLGYVQRSNTLHGEIENDTKEQEKISDKLKKLDSQLQKFEKQLNESSAKKKLLDNLKSTINIKKTVVAGKEDNLRSIDVPDYNGNVEELKKELNVAETEKDYQQVKNKQNEIDKEVARITAQLEELQAESVVLQKNINDLEVKKQVKRDLEKQKDNLIETIKNNYGIDENDDAEEALKRIKAERESQKKDITVRNFFCFYCEIMIMPKFLGIL
jgi:DNA repair protein RAD50